jgi:hypothetical protein
MTPGGTSQTVQVSIAGQNGFSGSVDITASGLPTGITASPSTLSVNAGSTGFLTLSAASSAINQTSAVSFNGTSGALTASASLDLSVMGAGLPDPFHLIGGDTAHGFYDASRQLLFVTNPGLNELDVISTVGHLINAPRSVPAPWGIDQMADGKTLVLGTQAQQIVTVDEDTFAVTHHPFSEQINSSALFFPNVVAMANGKVLVIGKEQGIDSNNILDGGQSLWEWNSNTGSFTKLEPPSSDPSGLNWETDQLARSADHQWAVFSADQFYLYSSASDTLTTAPLDSLSPSGTPIGVRGYAINADGSEIAVASADQVTFLNRSLAILGTANIPSAFPGARSSVQFTPDGKKLLLQYALPLAIEEIDASTYTPLGYVYGDVNADSDNLQRLLGVDSSGHAYAGLDGGVLVLNLASPIPNPANAPFQSAARCPVLETALPLNQSQQVTLTYPPSDTNIYIGGQPAPLSSDGTVITIPASSKPGPADIECVDSKGDTDMVLADVSYGVDPVGLSANLFPPNVVTGAFLAGYGFSPQFSSGLTAPNVSVNGAPSPEVKPDSLLENGALQGDEVAFPTGVAGTAAPVQVSSSLGSGTLPGPAYYATPTIVPASGILQLLYDSHRNLLYVLEAGQIQVLDPSSLTWRTPISLPAATGTATVTWNSMALTPDGSKLIVEAAVGSGAEVVVLDPDGFNAPQIVTDQSSAAQFLTGSIATTSDGRVILATSQHALQLDLSTLTFSYLNPTLGSAILGDVVRASADGSLVCGEALDVSSGDVACLHVATNQVQSEGFGQLFWTDLAVSSDGSQMAAIDAPPGSAGDAIGFFTPSVQMWNTNVYPALQGPDDSGVLGATFSPHGKTLVVPLGDSIEIWNATTGTLLTRLMTPEELQRLVNPEGAAAPMIALDSTGQTIFAASASGIIVIQLPAPLDQMPDKQWPVIPLSVKAPPSSGYHPLSTRVAAFEKSSNAPGSRGSFRSPPR